ncbi:MAG: cysteine desulfurase [archaeon]
MNTEKIRQDFEILKKGIIYFDNACMTLRPNQVIEEISRYYKEFPSCSGRSNHQLAIKATEEYESARDKIRHFINAKSADEIIHTKNTTEAINIVVNSFPFEQGKATVSSDREHNSNLIPWQFLEKEKGIKHVIVESDANEEFSLKNFENALQNNNVQMVAIQHTSNIDGYILPIEKIIKLAHDFNAYVFVDAAQGAPHSKIDVRKLDVDFLAFSGHKACGPSGTGCLYGKKELLDKMQPFMSGGHTAYNSTYTTAEFEKAPAKFEAGLQDVAGMLGFGKACEYLEKIGMQNIEEHERKLNKIITERLSEIKGLNIIGVKDWKKKCGITSFNVNGMDIFDIAILLDNTKKIAIRAGMHCAHSWFNKRGLKGSARASLYFYNTEEEAKIFCDELREIVKTLGK